MKSIVVALLLAVIMASPARADACSAETLAQRGIMHELLTDAAKRGLRGKHHYSITFLTAADGVVVPAAQREKYPELMTVILQYQFERLTVTPERFDVMLWFKGVRQRVGVPFAAITHFIDPSVNVRIEPDAASHGQPCRKASLSPASMTSGKPA